MSPLFIFSWKTDLFCHFYSFHSGVSRTFFTSPASSVHDSLEIQLQKIIFPAGVTPPQEGVTQSGPSTIDVTVSSSRKAVNVRLYSRMPFKYCPKFELTITETQEVQRERLLRLLY